MLFFKIVNEMLPISLPEYITVVEADQVRYTRRTAAIVDNSDISTLSCSVVPDCDSFRNSYFYRTMLAWNKLPAGVRQSVCIASFKTDLITFLWTADTDWPD